jgi:UDP-N-acetylmuramyl pentapeptide phosphotransferase/UDP-N-acetylglucosamine-1-phosphate transferase
MAVNLAACVTAFLISFITLPVIIKYFLSKNLVDTPGRRKIHKKVTPSMGGISIFIGFLIATLIWMDFSEWQTSRYVLSSLFIVFILGVRDDIVPFQARQKLFGQIVAVIILLFSGIQIHSLYGFFGVNEIPTVIGYLITAFVIVLITNSFNLIDGLDGLAATVSMVALTFFGVWFYFVGDTVFALLCFAMIGGILAFLVFNWSPAEIFMGDTGAMVIGMLLGVMVIHFMNTNYELPDENSMKYAGTVASGVAVIIIPLSDTLRIIILRISRGQSPFSPDKSHIHHAIMRLGMTHAQTSMILGAVNLFFVSLVWLFRDVPDIWLLPTIVVFAIIFSIILDRLILRRVSSKS